MNSQLFFYDAYERHKKIANFVGDSKTILDVGGQLDALSQFTKGKKITVANIAGSQEKSDVLLKGNRLPFKNNNFDCVCAIDVLEHIEGRQRESFIGELVRVASQSIVLSFPIGTPQHNAYEIETQKYLKKRGIDITYLKEHIKYKLPTVEEIDKICKDLDYKMMYSGNIKINRMLFKYFVFDPKIKYVRRANYYLKLAANLLTNQILYATLSKKQFSENVNRAYLVIHKK